MSAWLLAALVPAVYVLGAASAFEAIFKARTAQGATAWAVALVAMPFAALPLYWLVGRSKFEPYVEAVRSFDERIERELEEGFRDSLADSTVELEEVDDRSLGELRGFGRLATTPFTRGNRSTLLIDGEATFEAIFAGIDAAESYVLVQYYLIRDDEIGGRLLERLEAALRRDVRVYLMYDDIGSHSLSERYRRRLEEAGASVSSFYGRRAYFARFRLNFRNHRKIVVIDGVRGFLGGLNVGDEYLGRDPSFENWRDTHLEIEGPAVLGLQFSFLRDWYYGQQELPQVDWRSDVRPGEHTALVLASGPADRLETCGLFYGHAIESAEHRVWIATPYFVPDGLTLGALQLAALRGVDVRILMPRESDSPLFKFVPYAYISEAEACGVEVYLYEKGFMHQKVVLVDDDYATVGTANFDNRSFRLNFEITYLVANRDFCREVEEMLTRDFEASTRLSRASLEQRHWSFRLATQCTRLLAPLL